jgi:hypothetical protein
MTDTTSTQNIDFPAGTPCIGFMTEKCYMFIALDE